MTSIGASSIMVSGFRKKGPLNQMETSGNDLMMCTCCLLGHPTCFVAAATAANIGHPKASR
eukprot:5115186-Prorocentrum_lima.AAC.1